MTTETENRLRAALSARAEQVTSESLRPPVLVLPVSPKRSPVRLLTFAVPLTAVAAVLAVIISMNVAKTPEAHTVPASTAGPNPTSSAPPSGSPSSDADSSKNGTGDDHEGSRGGPDNGTGSHGVDPTTVDINLAQYPTLAKGDRNDAVKVLQKLLNELGYNAGPIDGSLGRQTADAMHKFIVMRHLDESGTFTSLHWTALLSSGARPALREGSKGQDVRRLQRALTAALGRQVFIDGRFGSVTLAAVKEFQTKSNLPSTGVVDGLTWAALGGKKFEAEPPSPPTSTPSPTQPTSPPATASDALRAATNIGSQTGENGGA